LESVLVWVWLWVKEEVTEEGREVWEEDASNPLVEEERRRIDGPSRFDVVKEEDRVPPVLLEAPPAVKAESHPRPSKAKPPFLSTRLSLPLPPISPSPSSTPPTTRPAPPLP